MATLRVIIQGRIERKEFQEPFRQCIDMLQQIGTTYEIPPVQSNEPIDFALFFQSYPHEFLQTHLMQLRLNNPFAPFFFVLGTCCEGMFRTASSQTLLYHCPFYCYAHAWSAADETEQIRRFLTDQSSVFSLPLTVENDEIAQWQNPVRFYSNVSANKEKKDEQDSTNQCLILSKFGHFGNDSAMNLFLADEQRRQGFMPVFSETMLSNPFSGKVFADADDVPREQVIESIQSFRQKFADNDLTIYVDSPRIDEKEEYLRVGATRIVPKMKM